MTHRLLVVPTAHDVGVTSVCLGIVRALDRLGVRFAFCKPIATSDAGPDRSTALIRLVSALDPPEPISQYQAERLLGEGDEGQLLEQVVEQIERASANAEVLVIEGLVPLPDVVYAARLNVAMAQALDVELVLVGSVTDHDPAKVADHIDIVCRAFGDRGSARACILNKVRLEEREERPPASTRFGLGASVGFQPRATGSETERLVAALRAERYHPLGVIPWRDELGWPRVKDAANALGAEVVHAGEWERRRVRRPILCAAGVSTAVQFFEPGALLITPGDRDDIVMAASLAASNGMQLAGLLLTCGSQPAPQVLALCRRGLEAGLPVLSVAPRSFETACAVHEMSREVPPDDRERAEAATDWVANHLDSEWLRKLAATTRTPRVTTPAFRHQLIERSRRANRRIVLPEGDEPRTVAAAAICAERGIARPVLLGDPAAIRGVAQRHGVQLDGGVEILDPHEHVSHYVGPMVELRRHKGLTEAAAADQLQDHVVLGTMMLKLGEVHGLVSGAVHTTANTIRPALQLIKTAPGSTLVSSVFFMCLPEQVLVYGDCAVNPNPTADELAEIAVQSAASAHAFGIEPRVAMISYSTGSSGAGSEVEKVARATEIARARRPDLLIDGPLQYDAAAILEVGTKKAPGSQVAGRATVFVFPDLNTGNTTYKAVQRSANVVSIGPMLQGLGKPVNDLSRGALVEDIVFTIAITAIQAATTATTAT